MVRILVVCLCCGAASAADWYVSPAGANGNPGTQASPWATIAKALASSAAGDRILLQRGGTWRETFTIGGGRQLLAYGSGADPEITASQSLALTGTWASNGAVRTAVAPSAVSGLWVAGAFQRLARYPNKGASPEWLRVDGPAFDGDGDPIPNTSTTVGIIRDAQLPAHAAHRWDGAQVRWRRWSWWWETRAIANDNGTGVLTLGANPVGYDWADGVGGNELADRQGSSYYVDNDLDELDAPGEWFWGGGTLYVYPPGGPITTVEVATSTAGVTSSGATITGIAFRRFQGTALTLAGASTIDGCTFEEIEDTALAGTFNAGGSAVRNCVFRDVRNLAISWWADPAGAAGTVIERNLLHRIGMERGYGGSGTWHAAGMILGNGNHIAMRLNRLVDIGYCGVILGSAGQTVDRNVFVRTMQSLNDGAAVYTNCSGSTITGNIILDTLGDTSTSHPWFPLGNGIWPEFLSDFHDQVITGNTISGCNGDGVMLTNEYTCTITGNAIADCRSSALDLGVQVDSGHVLNSYGVYEDADNDLRAQNHVIDGNVIATVSPTRRIARPETLTKWWLPPYTAPLPRLVSSYGSVDYGTMSHSSFVVPASGSDRFARSTPDATWTTLSAWSTANSSWAQNGDRLVTANAYLLINDTEAPFAMPVPAGSWTLHDGSAVGATVTVPSFRSAMLITSGAVPATPYTVASGIDWRAVTPTAVPLGGGPALPQVSIVASDAVAAEPADVGGFTVTRAPVTAAPLTVVLSVGGTATSVGDYAAIAGTVTIPANQASASIAVTPVDDGAVEAGETVVVAIAADAAYAIASPSSATVTIGDNDGAPVVPVVTIVAGDPTAGEGGDPGSFTVTRSPSSASALTVNLLRSGTAGNGGDHAAIAATVVIAAGQGTATISVVPVDDGLVEGAETVVVGIGAGGGGAYSIGAPGSATVTISDNDGSGGGGGGSGGGGGGGGCGAGSALALLAAMGCRLGWRRRAS